MFDKGMRPNTNSIRENETTNQWIWDNPFIHIWKWISIIPNQFLGKRGSLSCVSEFPYDNWWQLHFWGCPPLSEPRWQTSDTPQAQAMPQSSTNTWNLGPWLAQTPYTPGSKSDKPGNPRTKWKFKWNIIYSSIHGGIYPLPSLIRGGYSSSKFFLFKLTFVNLPSVGVQHPRHRQDSYPPLTTHWCGAGSAASQQTTGRRWCVCHWPWIVHPQVWKSSCRDFAKAMNWGPLPNFETIPFHWGVGIRKEKGQGPICFCWFLEVCWDDTVHCALCSCQLTNCQHWLLAQGSSRTEQK